MEMVKSSLNLLTRTPVVLAAALVLMHLGCKSPNFVSGDLSNNGSVEVPKVIDLDLPVQRKEGFPPLIGNNDRWTYEADSVPVPGPGEIWLHGMEYRPAIISVTVGTTITWLSVDPTPHDVCSYDGLFFATLAEGGILHYTFTEPGVYRYGCGCNPGMEGEIIVK